MSNEVRFDNLPETLRSDYLDTCFPNEMLSITDVSFDLEKRIIKANVTVVTDFENTYASGKNNIYHWSSITAYRAVSQLALGYLCTDLDKKKEDIGEVIQMFSEIRTSKMINEKIDVPLEISISKYFKREDKLLGQLDYSLAEGSFKGSIRFFVPLDK